MWVQNFPQQIRDCNQNKPVFEIFLYKQGSLGLGFSRFGFQYLLVHHCVWLQTST